MLKLMTTSSFADSHVMTVVVRKQHWKTRGKVERSIHAEPTVLKWGIRLTRRRDKVMFFERLQRWTEGRY